MLKHFYLGRRANFPLIFIVTVAVLSAAAFAIGHTPNFQTKNIVDLLIAVVGSAAAFVYFLYGQHNQDTKLFVNLFEKFNNRYNKLNEKLNAIISRPINSPLIPEQIDTLYDYFNLCAEEHLFYESGYIDERVWKAWLRGMSHFAKDATVRRLWEDDLAAGSYYQFNLRLVDAVV